MSATRTPIFAALLLLAAAGTAAAADIPGDASTRATLRLRPPAERTTGVLESERDRDWYRVELRAGVDYALHGRWDDDGFDYGVRVFDRRGREIGSLSSAIGGFEVGGVEFRLETGGTYFVSVEGLGASAYPVGYEIGLAPDCRGDVQTTCRLALDRPQARSLAFSNDNDFFRVELAAGRAYDVTLRGQDRSAPFNLEILDRDGRRLAENFRGDAQGVELRGFRPRRAGTYFVNVTQDALLGGLPYTIGISAAGR